MSGPHAAVLCAALTAVAAIGAADRVFVAEVDLSLASKYVDVGWCAVIFLLQDRSWHAHGA